MLILAQVGGVGRRVAGAGGGIDHLAVVLGDGRHLEFVESVAIGIGKAMPTPIAENADGHGFGVILGEGLQAGDIEVEGEAAVADGHGAIGVEVVDFDVVTGDESVAINRRGGLRGRDGGGGYGAKSSDGQNLCDSHESPLRLQG